jgi:hypothetical protein
MAINAERAARLTADRERRRQLADLRRKVEAGEPDAIEIVQRMFNVLGKAMADWLESIRPALNRMCEAMDTPEVRAWLAEREAAWKE